jgi:putative protease
MQEREIPKTPEILAPAGGISQFLAALNSGADAVFLGLKQFNARARAENFAFEDLEKYVPLAHQYGMKVLVTLNILIKEEELEALIDVLGNLARIEVDGVIVQDLGLFRLLRENFSSLPIHASTQLAVHNLNGVKVAKRLGAKRVVLARELTALELKKINAGIQDSPVELETFCHGSLCYSYSGLCFFSGQDDARSGNRGECAYTCRKPYKILNEPGAGFLFSMKDLDTLDDLSRVVDAGIHTLKIEGRKKDAQYVATVVSAYREKLDSLANHSTLRSSAPSIASVAWPDARKDMAFSFQRAPTSLFLKGRYHENVIDLDNPTHKGELVGLVEDVVGNQVTLKTNILLERFDGIRIDPSETLYHSSPLHGHSSSPSSLKLREKYVNQVQQFSLREMYIAGKRVVEAQKGQFISIMVPTEFKIVKGDLVYKTRSVSLKNRVEQLSQTSDRIRKLDPIDMEIVLREFQEKLLIRATVRKAGAELFSETLDLPAVAARQQSPRDLEELFIETFSVFGGPGFKVKNLKFSSEGAWFIPQKQLRELKARISSRLEDEVAQWQLKLCEKALFSLNAGRVIQNELSFSEQNLSVKIDRLEYLEPIHKAFLKFRAEKMLVPFEIIFEPKRAFLGTLAPEQFFESLLTAVSRMEVTVRLALPTVIRAWDEPVLKRWLTIAYTLGIRRFEIGNIGAKQLIDDLKFENIDISSDFTLYAMNQLAVKELKDLGISRYSLSLENDRDSLTKQWLHSDSDGIVPESILYKDTPLFIAESCSLTALHGGCPSSQVCGYRTLEIANDEGEEFLVVHETCKSVVLGKKAFSISEDRNWTAKMGIKFLRVDFLSRPYDEQSISKILESVGRGIKIDCTHSGNHFKKLL